MRKFDVSWILAIYLCIITTTTILGQSIDDTIPCPVFTPSPTTGNVTNLAILASYCDGDTRCEQQYGQSVVPNLTLFELLFQSSTQAPPPFFLEYPLLAFLCDGTNMTWRQANAKLWTQFLKGDMCERGLACENDETVIVEQESGNIDCGDITNRQKAEIAGMNMLGVALLCIILIVLSIDIGTRLWASKVERLALKIS